MTENFRRSARKFCSIAGTFRNVLFPSRNMKIFITVYIIKIGNLFHILKSDLKENPNKIQ